MQRAPQAPGIEHVHRAFSDDVRDGIVLRGEAGQGDPTVAEVVDLTDTGLGELRSPGRGEYAAAQREGELIRVSDPVGAVEAVFAKELREVDGGVPGIEERLNGLVPGRDEQIVGTGLQGLNEGVRVEGELAFVDEATVDAESGLESRRRLIDPRGRAGQIVVGETQPELRYQEAGWASKREVERRTEIDAVSVDAGVAFEARELHGAGEVDLPIAFGQPGHGENLGKAGVGKRLRGDVPGRGSGSPELVRAPRTRVRSRRHRPAAGGGRAPTPRDRFRSPRSSPSPRSTGSRHRRTSGMRRSPDAGSPPRRGPPPYLRSSGMYSPLRCPLPHGIRYRYSPLASAPRSRSHRAPRVASRFGARLR